MNTPTSLERKRDIWDLSGYKTRATAEYYFEVKTADDIAELPHIYAWARANKLPFFILGWGMNCLFAFDVFPGVIIKNSLNQWAYHQDTKILESESNASIWDIASELEEEYKQPLWYRFIGLPGSVGWAIYGNAWCFGLETGWNFLDAEILDLHTGEQKIFVKSEMQFSYRSSFLKGKRWYFLVRARFDLSEVREKYHSDVDNLYFREHKQPKWNTCGSFFKNPTREQTAGMLIEAVWGKWMRKGWAFFSSLHANFLMSDGRDCHWKDLISLIEEVEQKVYDQFRIRLEREVQIIYPLEYVPL